MATQMSMKRILTQSGSFRMIHMSCSSRALPTDFFQKSLPFLPLPTLEDSMSLYLDRRKAVLSTKSFKELEKLGNTFMQGNGKKLHEQLVNIYRTDKFTYYGGENFIKDILYRRDPIIKQSGGTFIWNVGPEDSQLVRASKLIYSSGRVSNSLKDNSFPPVVMHYNPLFEGVLKQTNENYRTQVAMALGMIPFDMKSYPKIFGSSRIPGLERDTIKTNEKSKNYVIIRNGHLFTFDLITDNGSVIDVNEIHATLKKIKEMSNTPSSFPVAALTNLKRTTWAKYRNHLLTDEHNANLLQIIEESIGVLSLDDSFEEDDLEKNIHIGKYPGNRWFDKAAFLSVDESSGYTGLGGNSAEYHAAVAADVIEALRKAYRNIEYYNNAASESSTLKHLQFNIDDRLHLAIEESKKAYSTLRDGFQCVPFARSDINNSMFKRRFLNPSSMIQLALQISLIKMFGKPHPQCSPILTPTFINSHSFYATEPTTLMADLAQRFVLEEKLDMAAVRNYSEAFFSNILQARMGINLFVQHLDTLFEIALKTNKLCDFLNSRRLEDPSTLNIVTIPQKVAKNVIFSEGEGGLGFSYVFNDEGMNGIFMSVEKQGPPIKEFSKLFFETLERLIHHISK